ncbi:MAG TPA: TatD family hydrolase, partial [Bacteroidales bacterium]|nr:TatD family hydrolase [Bacteroidales bacterium]
MFFVDTHAHLYKEYYPENFDDVLRRSLEAEVTKIILPCVNANSMPDILEAVEKHPKHLFPLVGLHPSDVKADYEEELTQLEKYLSLNDSLIGVGEIGIDLYHDKTFIKEQEIAFQRQLTWAAERNLPVSIHIRDGYEEAFRILKPFVQNGLNGVLHCFSGGIQEARWAVSYGLKLGIG